MNPKITIITPSYNQAKFIGQTIDSVLSQGYQNVQYIIVDGGSTDGTVEIIKRYEKYLSYWVSEPDKGQSDAINKGLAHATGEVVNWLNSDDYLEPEALQILAGIFEDPEISVVVGRSNIIREGRVLYQSTGTDIYPGNLAKTIGLARIDQPETYFRKTVIDQMGPLNPSLHFLMDKEWWIRYLLIYGLQGIRKVDAVLTNFRLHKDSKTVSRSHEFLQEGLAIILELSKRADHAFAMDLISPQVSAKLPIALPGHADVNIIRQSLNYTFLYLADYHYYHHYNNKLAKEFLNLVKLDALSHEDVKWHKRLKRRLAVPASLRRLFH